MISLVPLIDLLLCCIMFLLAAATWNQIYQHKAVQSSPVSKERSTPESTALVLRILHSGYVLEPASGEPIDIHKIEGQYDLAALRIKLLDYANRDPRQREVFVRPEDGVNYSHVVKVMEAVTSARLRNVASIEYP